MKKNTSAIVLLMLATAFASGCDRQTQSQDASESEATSEDAQKDFKSLEDRFSYAYGADLGEKFRADGIKLNVALMAEAMQAAIEGGEKKMDAGEVAATLEIYREVYMKEKEEKRAAASEKNKKEGPAFLAENAKKEGVVVTKSGLQYKVITPGTGDYKPKEDDIVKVHYRATFVDGTEFDSTYKRNQPYSVPPRQLIKGFTEALQLMTAGSKWVLYIPAELAYGEQGSDPYVGPDAALIFEVELLEVEKRPASDAGQ
jgi:FKBP-type peptidyl-prolyl cis-trans isomerase